MSHGDRVTALAPGFSVIGTSPERPLRHHRRPRPATSTPSSSTPRSTTPSTAPASCKNFTDLAGFTGDWTMAAYKDQAIAAIRAQVGAARVICGLSGGVDSSVAAVLIHEAIGDQLTCVFVDNGLMRQGEAEQVVTLFRDHYNIPLVHADETDRFLDRPRRRRRPRSEAQDHRPPLHRRLRAPRRKPLATPQFLAQGTLYPDVIESVSFSGGPSVTIKSHHNVGGLPERMHLKLVEPLRELFKDEVRALGRELGLPEELRRPPPLPRPRPRHPLPRRHHPRQARHPPPGRRDLSRPDPPPRPLRRDLAGLRRPPPRPHRRRHGRRPHLRPRLRAPRRHLRRRHDRRLVPLPPRRSSPRPPPASSTRSRGSTASSTTSPRSPPAPSSGSDMPRGGYAWAKALTPDRKAEIIAACERLIAETIRPTYLPVIRPTQFNYPVDIHGRMAGRELHASSSASAQASPRTPARNSTRPSPTSSTATAASSCTGCATPAAGGRSTATSTLEEADRQGRRTARPCGRRYEAARAGPLSHAGRNRRRDPCNGSWPSTPVRRRRCAAPAGHPSTRPRAGRGRPRASRPGWTGAEARRRHRRPGLASRQDQARRRLGHLPTSATAIAGYVVVEAPTHEAAAQLFENHPHFAIFPGDSVEIMECLPIPER